MYEKQFPKNPPAFISWLAIRTARFMSLLHPTW